MITASVGSNLKMERAYVDEAKGQTICCWDAPDQKSVEQLFAKAQIKPESIKKVIEYTA